MFYGGNDEIDIEPPTPSPFFPKNLGSLLKMKPEDARALVKDYGLEDIVEEQQNENQEPASVEANGNKTPEQHENSTNTTATSNSTGEGGGVDNDNDNDNDHQRNLKRIMVHIGVSTCFTLFAF